MNNQSNPTPIGEDTRPKDRVKRGLSNNCIEEDWPMIHNQCDGCQRGIPVTYGIHKDEQGFGMSCTKGRYMEKPKKSRLLRNALQTPDGTILESRTRHDYKEYEDENGWIYIVDGGLDYSRRMVNRNAPETELSLTEDVLHSIAREFVTWGTYGKSGDQPRSYIAISDMSTGHLKAVIDTQKNMYPQVRDLMKAELEYREVSGFLLQSTSLNEVEGDALKCD